MQTSSRTAATGLLILLTVASVAITGCGTAGGGGFSLFPSRHRLLEDAKIISSHAPRHAALPRELQKHAFGPYIVEPGDGLLIEPASFDAPLRFAPDQTVLPDGTIDLGRYGRPIVAGRTLEDIEAMIHAAVDAHAPSPEPEPAVRPLFGNAPLPTTPPVPDQPERFNVRLINPESKVFYVLGEVHAPGAFPLVGRETVLDAIMAAGGLSNRADQCAIILARATDPDGCRLVLPICYRAIVQLGDSTTNYQIMPGDRVFVATRSCWDEICGCFKKDECPLCRGCHRPCGAEVCRDPIVAYDSPIVMGEGTPVESLFVGEGTPVERLILDEDERYLPPRPADLPHDPAP